MGLYPTDRYFAYESRIETMKDYDKKWNVDDTIYFVIPGGKTYKGIITSKPGLCSAMVETEDKRNWSINLSGLVYSEKEFESNHIVTSLYKATKSGLLDNL
jgi:hypothetical protein